MKSNEIIEAIASVSQKLEDGAIDMAVYKDTIDSLHGELGDKLDAMSYLVDDLEKDVAVFTQESKRLKAVEERKKSTEKKITSLKSHMAYLLSQSGAQKLRTEHHVYGVRKAKRPVLFSDESQIPERFWVTPEAKKPEPKIDKKAIYDALKAGESVAGAYLGDNQKITY